MHKVGIIALVLVAALGALPANVQASQFTVQAQISPAPISNGGTATLTVHTRIGSDCIGTVLYNDGALGPELPVQHVGNTGIVTWHWVASTTTGGGTAAGSCVWKGQQQADLTLFQVAGALPKGKVIIVWSGKQAGKGKGFDVPHSSVFTFRGPFDITADARPLDPKKIATAGTVGVETEVTDHIESLDAFTFGVGDVPAAQHAHLTETNCKVGCTVYVLDPVNIQWTITVTQ